MTFFTLAVLPDTQIYTASYPRHFAAQGLYLAENASALELALVVHEGDVTNESAEREWMVARRSFAPLDGRVPYLIALGNHDYGPGGSGGTRETLLHRYFELDVMKSQPTFGGSFEPDRLDNAYHLLETRIGRWLVIALEFAPRESVARWAKEVLDRHRDVPAVLVTHAFLYHDSTRYDQARLADQKWHPGLYGVARGSEPVFDPESLYRELVAPCSNLKLVLSGHVLTETGARRTDRRPDGTLVHQVLANYQNHRDGGEGYLRLLRFERDRVHVRTYSPSIDREKRDEHSEFTLELR
jgi:hypothetical protein